MSRCKLLDPIWTTSTSLSLTYLSLPLPSSSNQPIFLIVTEPVWQDMLLESVGQGHRSTSALEMDVKSALDVKVPTFIPLMLKSFKISISLNIVGRVGWGGWVGQRKSSCAAYVVYILYNYSTCHDWFNGLAVWLSLRESWDFNCDRSPVRSRVEP